MLWIRTLSDLFWQRCTYTRNEVTWPYISPGCLLFWLCTRHGSIHLNKFSLFQHEARVLNININFRLSKPLSVDSLSWCREFSSQSLMGFWQHLLSGYRVCGTVCPVVQKWPIWFWQPYIYTITSIQLFLSHDPCWHRSSFQVHWLCN